MSRGFGSMDQQRQREAASRGGKKAHELGKAHEFTPDEARIAGAKGGVAVSRNLAHMREIGRKGGRRAAERREREKQQAPVTEGFYNGIDGVKEPQPVA